MTTSPRAGLALALFGALVLTPDALLLRLSDMTGMQMLGWRGLCMGALFLTAWALTSRDRRADLSALATGAAGLVILCQYLNAMLFPVGIATGPVAAVLIGVATVPVWAALLARVLHGETTSRATWITIGAVLCGIALAISEKGPGPFDRNAALAALCGLGVAAALALNFVTLRFNPRMPLLLVIGTGALLAGATGWTVTGPARMADGQLWAILITALFIIPVSFFCLSQASRHTSAANVSLLLLLETVLGPVWVWLGTGEAPGQRMLFGGAIVVLSLGLYIARTRPRRAPRRA